MLLEAAVDVDVEGVLIVLDEVLPCAVVVDSEDVVSDVAVVPDVSKKTILTNKYELPIYFLQYYKSLWYKFA